MIEQTSKNSGVGTKLSRDSSGERFARLAAMGEQLFHTSDLATIWGIRNRATLHMTISRYVAQGLLYRIHRGFYSIKPLADIHPYQIGIRALHRPAYISGESVLFDAGVINQPPRSVSIVSNVSRRFTLAGNHYRVRKLTDVFLYNDAGIIARDDVRVATTARAVADTLYFHPKKHFDVPSAIPWHEVRAVATAVGYSLTITHTP